MTTDKKSTVIPELMAEAVGNGRWRYFLFNVIIEADSKEESDALILEAKEIFEGAEQLNDDTWKYPELNVRISAATKEDADKRAMDYFQKRRKQPEENEAK